MGSTLIVSANSSRKTRLPALVAAGQDDLEGVATFEIRETAVRLITLNALEPGCGDGSALWAGVGSGELCRASACG